MSPPYSLMLRPPNIRPPNNGKRIPVRRNPSTSAAPSTRILLRLPHSRYPPYSQFRLNSLHRWRPLEWVQRIQCVYPRNHPGFCQEEPSHRTSPGPRHRPASHRPASHVSQCRLLHRMTVTAQYARQTDFHGPPFRPTPSHDAATKSFGPSDHGLGCKVFMIQGRGLGL
ncbi:hypothetical protein K438DRAFT_126762 [Mycena galopus ATCC 62051]|nr:hypothetical protein K438DRAFT_126762 [Mycena galopus ATCC 62051]